MKKITLLFSLVFVVFTSYGQQLWKKGALEISPQAAINKTPDTQDFLRLRENITSLQESLTNAKTAVDCTTDTTLFSIIKANGNFDFRGLAAPNGFLPSALQRFQVPDGETVTVNGFDFNGFMFLDTTSNLSMLPVNCAIYAADADGDPLVNNALATATVMVDTSGTNRADGFLSIGETTYSVTFPQPVVLTGSFFLEIQNPSTTNFVFLWTSAPATNGVGSGSGRGEEDGWYSLAQQGQVFYLPGTALFSIAQGTTDTTFLDQDNFLHPHVNFSIEAGFSLETGDCLPHGEISILKNESSGLAGNKYFNFWTADATYNNQIDTTFEWIPDLTTSTTTTISRDLITSYASPLTSATPVLFVNELGYSRFCLDSLSRTYDAGALAVADFSFTVDTNQTVVFANNSDNGDYLWDFGDGNTSTDVIPTHTYVNGGTYTVTLTVSGDGICPGVISKEVNVAATSIQDDLLNTQVNVFPNPSNGVFLLDINLDGPEEVRIEVRNMIGQTVFESPAQRMQAGEIQLNLDNQQSGIYLMTLWANDRQITRKLSLNK